MAEETPFSSLDPLGPEYGGINSPIVDSKGLAPFEGEMLRDPKINYPKPENYFPVLPKVSNLNRPNRAIEQNVVRTNANNPSIPYSKVSPQQKKASTSQYLDAFFQTNQNKNNYAKIFSYNAGPDGNNFYKRYAAYGQETFDKIGFHPLRNNEANFNAQVSKWDSFSTMMTNSFIPLATRGFLSGPKSLGKMLVGDFSGDREDAKAYEEAAAIGQSTRGGLFGFANNAMMNFGYTAGIMGEAILEEIGGALLAAPTGGASLVATTANIATKIPKLSLVQKTINGYNAVKSTLKSFDSIQTARQFWNTAASNKTLSAMGKGLNPLENTLDAFKTIQNTDNITDLAALSKTAGGFYRDVRKINMALAESRLEAGMVQNSVYDKLYHEAYMAKGEAPSNKEQADLEKQAKEASMETLLANTALIYASNAITFNNITGPRGGLRNFLKSSTDDIYEIASREGAKDFGKLGKVVYDKAARQFELQKSGLRTWAKGWTKDPIYKSVLGTVGYFKSNFTEGIQENLQEVIAQANERYYVDSYKSPTLQTQLYSKGVIKANLRPKKDYYSDALKDQFNSTGAETFASGFFMGALASPINSAIPFLSSTWNRTFDKKGFTKWKEAQMSVAENLKNELNSVSMKDFMSDKVLNLGAQDMISKIRDKASKKEGLDAETEAYINHVGTMRRTGTSGLFMDTMKSFKEMDDKEFAEALKISEDQVDKYRGRIDSGIARIERVNNIFNTAERKYPNPVNLNNLGEEGTPEYEAKLTLYKAWNRGIENMAFFHENYDDTKSRRAAIQNKYNNNENFKSLNTTDKLLLFQPERISDEVKMLERELATEKEGENRSAKVNALENKINLLNNYSEAHTAFDKFFNRAEYAKSVKEMLQKETGKEPTAEEISDKLDDILGSLDNEDLKVENIQKLKEAHNNYLKGVAQSNDDRIFDEHTDEGFEALIDYYKLGHESRALAEYIDMFNDPAAFMDVVQKNVEWMRKFNAQRVKYFEDLIHSEMGKVRDNAFLNTLADNQIYLNKTDMENYLGDKNIPPSEIYDGKAKKVYPAGSEEYKKIYAEYFEKRAQLKAQMNPKKTGVVKKTYQEQIDELNRKMQEEIDALPTTPTRVELDDIKRKGGNKSVTIQEINEQLENDQYVEVNDKDAIAPMVFYKNTDGELLYDNAEGAPVILSEIKTRFTEAKRFKLEEKPDESEVKKIKDRYEVKIAEVMEAYNADMKAIDDEVPYEEITQDSNLDTADLVEFKQMLYNEFYDNYVVTLPQEVQDSIYGDDNIADAEFEKWYRLAENKKYFDKYNKANKPAVSKSDITFTYEGTDINTKDLSLPELIKYRDAINAKIELLDNNLKVNDEFEDEETVDNTKELRDLETDLKNINTIIQRRQYSGFSEEVREGVKKIQKLLTAQKGVEEKYLLTEDDSVTGLKKGEIAYRVNGLIHRRMTNAIQEVLPKKYEYAAKQGVETAFNNSIAKKGLNEDSINDFIDSLNGLLAIDKLPGTNKDFLKNLKTQLRNLSGMSPAQIKLEKQKDKLLTQIANKDKDIIKAEKAGNENRVNQLVEQKNSIFNELAQIEKEIKGLPSTTTPVTGKRADIEKRREEETEKVKERKVGSTFTLGKDVKIIVNGFPSIIKKGETITIKSVTSPGKSKLKGSAAKNAPDTLHYTFDVTGFEGEIINRPGQAVVTHMLSETALIASIDAKYDAELAALGTTDTKADIERRKKETIDSIKEGYNGGKTWNYIGQFSNQITKEVKYQVSQDEYTKEQLIEEIKNDYNTELTDIEKRSGLNGVEEIIFSNPNFRLEGFEIDGNYWNVVTSTDRAKVIVNINGVIVPFYLTTGQAGKGLIPGWYPFFGIGNDGWLNKTDKSDMETYYERYWGKDAADIVKSISKDLNNFYGTDPASFKNDGDPTAISKPLSTLADKVEDYINSKLSYTPAINDANARKNLRNNVEQLGKEINTAYDAKLASSKQPTAEITNEALSNNTTFDIIMNTFMEETYQDSRDAGNYVDDAKDYLESGVKPKFDPAKLSQEAYEDMFGLNGYLTKLKQKVDSGEFYLIGRDLVVYDSNITRPDGKKDRIAGEIDLLLATKNGIMIVDIKSGEQRKWQNFNKNSKDPKKLNYTKREEYTLQQGGYATMLERMIDYPVAGIALLPIERASNKETNQMVSAGKPDMSAPAVYNKIEFVKNEDGTYKRNEFGELVMNPTNEKSSEWFIPLYRNSVQDRLDILFPPSTVKFMPGLKDKAKKEFDSYTTDLQAITDADTDENKKELANIENKINEFAELNNLAVPEALKELLKEKQLALGKVVGKNLIDKIVTKYTNLATKSKNDVDKLVTRLAQTKSDISFDEIDLSPESAFIQEQLEKDKAFAQRFATHEERFEGKTYKPTTGQLIAADTLQISGIITDDEYQAIVEENYNTSDVSLLIHNSVKRIQYLSANSDTTAEAKKFKDYQNDIFNLMFSTKVNQSNTAITNALNTAQEEITAGNIKRALDIIENEVYALERTLEKTKNDNVKKTIQDKINDLNSINEAIVITTGYVEEQFIPEQEVTEGELEEFDAEEQLDKIIVKKGMTLYSKNDKFTVQTINKNNTVTLKDSSGNELTVTMDDLNKNYKTESDLLGSEIAPETAPITKEEQEFVNQTEDSVDALLESADKTDVLMAEADKIKSSEDAEDDLLKDLNCKQS
jgi:hypothetical protein